MADPTVPVRVHYYLDDWSDEVVPCEPELQAWADWLAKPDEDWNHPKAAEHGQTFACSTMEILADIQATWGPDGWTFPACPPETDTVFFYFADPGGGWQAEDSVSLFKDDDEQKRRRRIREGLNSAWSGMSLGDVAWFACTRWAGSAEVRFEITGGGPRCVVVEPVGRA
jgi:hypothetical protein